jgi:hypothetical protein
LLYKKVVKRQVEARLSLTAEMTISDELVLYLQDILQLDDDKIRNIIGVFNDYSAEAKMG